MIYFFKASLGDKEGLVVGIGTDKSVVIKLYVYYNNNNLILNKKLIINNIIIFRPNEDTFTVPAEDVKIETPIAIGTVVTFSFENFSKRLSPVSPCVYRIRSDLSWDDVVYQANQEKGKIIF